MSTTIPEIAQLYLTTYRLFHIMLKSLPIMLFILTHYSILCFIKSNEFITQHKIQAFRVHIVQVHRPFSTTVQQITKDVTLFLQSEKLILLHYSH